jgi:putative membrane protein
MIAVASVAASAAASAAATAAARVSRDGPDAGPAVALTVMAIAYALGVRRAWRHAGRGRGVRRGQMLAFVAALAVLAIALLSPLDALSDDLFAAHMVQHVLLAVVVPPILVAGAPVVAMLWLLSPDSRRGLVRGIRAWRLDRVWFVITAPALGWLLHAAAIWLWHAPAMYELALRNAAAHALEHLCFVGTGVLLWWPILHPRSQRRTAYAVGVMTLFATAMQTGVLGALITLSHTVWYPAQAAGAAAWGLTPLEDQQLAGLIMWVPGGLLYVVAMSVLFVAWLGGVRQTAPGTPVIGGVASVRSIGTVGAALLIAFAGATGLTGCSGAHASAVPGGDAARGKQSIAAMGCGSCHEIAGVRDARGEVGPPLTGVARRSMLAGEVPNSPENMVRWIMNPQAIEPNTAMPNLGVSDQSARDIAAYLYTLR